VPPQPTKVLLLQRFFNFRQDLGNALESIVSIWSAKLANIVAAAVSKWRLRDCQRLWDPEAGIQIP